MSGRYIKSGRLFCLPLDCPDLERFILRRIFRRLRLVYIPFTLKFYDKLVVREDKSKYNRALINYCKKKGILTYVCQEGSMYAKDIFTYIPLFADYFLCQEQDYDFFSKHINSDRILTFYPQKRTEDYKGILFLQPLIRYGIHPLFWNKHNSVTVKAIDDYLKEDVVFKPHYFNEDLVREFIPFNRIVTGKAEELIRKYDKIYCFKKSSIRQETLLAGKEPILVDI